MELINKFAKKLKKGTYRAIITALFCYLLYHLINSGILLAKWPEKIKDLKTLTQVNFLYEKKINNLKSEISGLELNTLDIDLLDQKARKILGLTGKDEIIIYEYNE